MLFKHGKDVIGGNFQKKWHSTDPFFFFFFLQQELCSYSILDSFCYYLQQKKIFGLRTYLMVGELHTRSTMVHIPFNAVKP